MVEEKSDKVILVEAMEKGREAFESHIGDHGLDPAFFGLHLKGYVLSRCFEPMDELVDSAGFEDFDVNLGEDEEKE